MTKIKTKVFSTSDTVEALNKFLKDKHNVTIYNSSIGTELLTVVNYEE